MPAHERMRPVDAAWLHMDRPRNTADIVALLELDRPLPLARLRDLLKERLLTHPRFRQRVRKIGLARGRCRSWNRCRDVG